MFLTDRYDTMDVRIRWLCPRCHAFESKEMKNHQTMEDTNSRSSSDDESIAESSFSDDNVDGEVGKESEENAGSVDMNNWSETRSKGDNADLSCTSDEETDPESMNEEPADMPYDLEYQQNEAMDKLRTIFQLFNIDPIHDK